MSLKGSYGTANAGKVQLGICAMDKKTRSKPMQEILKRLPGDCFNVTIFGNDVILEKPIEEWPVVEVLIAFYSTNFPTEKALEYVNLRKPFMINDLEKDEILKDRRRIYEVLESQGIDVPIHVYCERDDPEKENVLEEFDEYIVVNGVQINKPLVEKPVDAEDHNIYIYYPMSAGGGSKRLFRKVNDRSSEFYPRANELRRSGSYIYEEFIVTQGTDVKVYTVGPDYGHAEARKSPVVDGKVNRDERGLEVRYPVILTPHEKEMARNIVTAFGQTVCGFDILRVHGKSYCCDVNGFSFVKNSRKYYDDASQILTELMLTALRPSSSAHLSTRAPIVRSYYTTNRESKRRTSRTKEKGSDVALTAANLLNRDKGTDSKSGPMSSASHSLRGDSPAFSDGTQEAGPFKSGSKNDLDRLSQDGEHSEELRCIIAVTRHGDRTPKQKMKIKVSLQKYLDYFHGYSKGPKMDLKVKSRSALVKFLKITREIVQDEDLQEYDPDLYNKLHVIIDVLERWEISGICRKLQMKPLAWADEKSEDVKERQDKKKEKKKATMSRLIDEEAEANKGSPDTSLLSNKSPLLDVSNASSPAGKDKSDAEIRANSRDNASGLGGILSSSVFGSMEPLHLQRSTSVASFQGSDAGKATEILLILKWGGDLTPMGRAQAEGMGANFRQLMYPDVAGGGVLRLHATYRHDLKIKASDEGRVMKTAAAFAKGLLELEGQLTPIIASLVTVEAKNKSLLDYSDNAAVKEDLDDCKHHLNDIQRKSISDEFVEEWAKDCPASIRQAINQIREPLKCLMRMHVLIGQLCAQLHRIVEMEVIPIADEPKTGDDSKDINIESRSVERSASEDLTKKLYLGETYALMLDRWEKLNKDFFNQKEKRFDLSKVPDVYDMIRYDILHNSNAELEGMRELYEGIRAFENTLVPQEYGANKAEKKLIGSKVCGALLEKIKYDLKVSRSDTTHDMRYMLDHSHAEDLEINSLGRVVRTRLYFTSESHMHTLLNVLRHVKVKKENGKEIRAISSEGLKIIEDVPELSYLTQIVIRLFEDREDHTKFRCEISFSPGSTTDIFTDKSPTVAPYKTINGNISCDDLIACLTQAVVIGKELPPEEADKTVKAEFLDTSTSVSTADHDLHLTAQPYTHGGEDSKTNFSKKAQDGSLNEDGDAPLRAVPNNFEDDDFREVSHINTSPRRDKSSSNSTNSSTSSPIRGLITESPIK